MPMQKPSRLLPDDSHHLMATDCVLPQVALWGKGMVCALKRTSGLNGWISNQKHISLQSVALREGSRGFEGNFKSGLNKGDNLYRDREKLVRTYEGLKNDIQTYENNLGFLSSASKKGNTLVTEITRKIERLKGEMELVLKKIQAIDEKLNEE